MSAARRVGPDVDRFTRRLLEDCLSEATQAYWMKRARDFENARPRIGDFHGQATPAQLRERWHRLTAIANACRARAQVEPLPGVDIEVERIWGEAS